MTGLGVGLAATRGLDAEAIGDEAADRALALVGARQPASRRCPVVLDAFVAAAFVGFIGGDAVGRRRPARALAVRRPRGRGGGVARVHAHRRRRRPRRPRQRALRRRGRRPAGARPDRGRAAPHASCSTRAPRARPGGHHGQRGPRLLPLAALGRAPTTSCSSRATATSTSLLAAAGDGPLRDRRRGPALGRQPRLRHLLRGRHRAARPRTASSASRCGRSRSPATSSHARGRSGRGGRGALGAVRRQRAGGAAPDRARWPFPAAERAGRRTRNRANSENARVRGVGGPRPKPLLTSPPDAPTRRTR